MLGGLTMEKEHLNETSLKIVNYIFKRFNTDFYFLYKHKNNIIENILKSEILNNLICTNMDTIDNNYINFYDQNYKLLITNNFVKNLFELSDYSSNINEFINENSISKKSYNSNYALLVDISLSNVHSFNVILLFQSIREYEEQFFNDFSSIREETLHHFITHYEFMIQEYSKKKEAIAMLKL